MLHRNELPERQSRAIVASLVSVNRQFTKLSSTHTTAGRGRVMEGSWKRKAHRRQKPSNNNTQLTIRRSSIQTTRTPYRRWREKASPAGGRPKAPTSSPHSSSMLLKSLGRQYLVARVSRNLPAGQERRSRCFQLEVVTRVTPAADLPPTWASKGHRLKEPVLGTSER